MMPQQTNIMQYVRDMEQKVRTLQSQQNRSWAKAFWSGAAWGAAFAGVVLWYVLRHGG